MFIENKRENGVPLRCRNWHLKPEDLNPQLNAYTCKWLR
jgi:hypothetical protein